METLAGLKFSNYVTLKDYRGSLISLEGLKNIPFEIKRIFYIFGVPYDVMRGGHAHKKCHQVFVAVSGTVSIWVNEVSCYHLNFPDLGLHVPPGHTVLMGHFSPNCVLLVLASEPYDPNDYIQ
jgi:dTDP-4-dehydrorhamnose 3,5-epimerase-like enzyme